MPRLSIHLLGSFHVSLDGIPITAFESNKVRALLAYLAVEADRPHSRDKLAGLLWPDQPDRTARRNLSQALFNLRRAIRDEEAQPPFLHVTRQAIQFNPDSDHRLDVTEFAAHIADGAVPRLEQAVRLYQEGFLVGFFVDDSCPFAEWATLRRERFHRQALNALHHLAERYERRRDYERAIRYAWRQVELEPWREEAHRQLMQALARSGQRSVALAQYERCCQAMAKELGVEPHHETTALYERIRMSGPASPHNLPAQLNSLLGREEELSSIAERLGDPTCRLLTLIGPGGIGKTCLALQAAYEALDAFLHGVYFVPLASARSSALLGPTVANALDLQLHGSRDPLEQLLDYLRERELLLVLDSFEHLLQGAGFVTDILETASHVKILVTSRERLNLRGEWLLDIQGLAYPQDDSEAHPERYAAMQLFLQNAIQVCADFTPSSENVPHIIHICQLLDGIPLGIELAATLVRTLSCEQIAHEIERDLDFLFTSLRDVPERHRSLRALFQYSWRLLSETEKAVLAKLSVFREPFHREAARVVAHADTAALSGLLDRSLLSQDQSGRYDLHALVKQYATEKLADSSERQQTAQRQHCHYYADLLYRQESALKGSQQREAQIKIGEVIGDVRTAWQWAIEHSEHDALDRSLESLYLFYKARGRYQEGREILALAAQSIQAGSLLQARALARQADFLGWLGEYDEARTLVQRSIEALKTLGARQELGFALQVLGRVEFRLSEYTKAWEHLQQSVAIFRQIGDQWGLAQALNYLGHVMCSLRGTYGEALPLYEESLALSRQMGNRSGVARALINLGAAEQNMGNYDQARDFYRESATTSREIGHRRNLAISLGNLGDVACQYGEYDRAADLLQESLAIKKELGDRFSLIYSLSHLGKVAHRIGRVRKAKEWYDQALQIACDIGATAFVSDVLIGVADLLATTGDTERAVELVQAALNHTGGDQEVKGAADKLLVELEAELPSHVVAACRQQGDAKSLETVVAEVLDKKQLSGS